MMNKINGGYTLDFIIWFRVLIGQEQFKRILKWNCIQLCDPTCADNIFSVSSPFSFATKIENKSNKKREQQNTEWVDYLLTPKFQTFRGTSRGIQKTTSDESHLVDCANQLLLTTERVRLPHTRISGWNISDIEPWP